MTDTITAIKKALEGADPIMWDKPSGFEIVDTISRQLSWDKPVSLANSEYVKATGPVAISELLSTLESLQRKNEELRDALKPFADYMGDHFDKDNHGDPLPDDLGVGWIYLTHADFRRARTALSSTGDTHGN